MMKTKNELNAEILRITMMIQEKYPELARYITEMPITIPNQSSPEITVQTLTDYHESLLVMLTDYGISHHIE